MEPGAAARGRGGGLEKLTPGLPPHELQAAGGGEVLLDGVVHSLDQHAGQVGSLQQVGHGGAVAEGVHGPAGARGRAYGRNFTALSESRLKD